MGLFPSLLGLTGAHPENYPFTSSPGRETLEYAIRLASLSVLKPSFWLASPPAFLNKVMFASYLFYTTSRFGKSHESWVFQTFLKEECNRILFIRFDWGAYVYSKGKRHATLVIYYKRFACLFAFTRIFGV